MLRVLIPFFLLLINATNSYSSNDGSWKMDLEKNLSSYIHNQRMQPSYRRGLMSHGDVNPEGLLKSTVNISESSLNRIGSILTTTIPDFSTLVTEAQWGQVLALQEQLDQARSQLNTQDNLIVPPHKWIDATGFGTEGISDRATFYPYNSEGIVDHSWGCCWRAAQTSLSTLLDEVPHFETLFHLFGPKENLRKIYDDYIENGNHPDYSPNGSDLFSAGRFSPYQHEYGWSNPFVSKLILHYFGISSHLTSVNGIPDSLVKRSIPTTVLDSEVNFSEFRSLILEHFLQAKAMPLIPDDGQFAMAMIGAKEEADGTVKILMADPHIQGGANNHQVHLIFDDNGPENSCENVSNLTAGIYWVQLDKLGRQIQNSVESPGLMFKTNSYAEIEFHKKPWMVLLPSFPENKSGVYK
ncbi:MAG: hypothetical protein HRU09_09975 [Oligoflexales bacterium]|nr:hypothetical protein [Oligoflexales bacterium]